VDDAIATIEHWISERSRNYVCIAGVHGVMESRSNQRLRRIHNDAGMVTPTACPWFGSYASSANGTWIACMVPI
jgi:N-acetylglucosaminyldiphosphoundecaprenol N-acetyl-beta-D-mannosaminyltransferase